MSYWKEGLKSRYFFLMLFGMFLMTSTIALCLVPSTSINNQNFYEKSTVPGSNDSPVNTTLLVLVESTIIEENSIVQIEIEVFLNITVFLRDNYSNPLHGATVELFGFGNMSEILNQYNYTLNTNELGLGIHVLTILAHLDGYQPQTFQFFVEVIGRATNIHLFVNTADKTADPVIDLPIGTLINITVKYYDNQTGLEIPNALVQLSGEGLVENLTENSILKQYTIILDSSNLYIGVSLFTIVAHALNYEMQTIDLRITVNTIKTDISGNSIISVKLGEVIHIEVELIDLDFGGLILDAIVVYSWQLGQGTLTDFDSDGIYETLLVGNMTGTFSLVITAFAGENYDFESFEIIIVITDSFEIPKIIIPGFNLFALICIIFVLSIVIVRKLPRKNQRVQNLKKKNELIF